MKQEQNFTQGKIFGPLIGFALPVLFALLLQSLYGAADLFIVGQFGGELADTYVSAVSTGSQVMMTATFMVTGLAMGLTVLVGRKVGAGESDEAGRIIGSGIWLFSVLAIVFTVVMVALSAFFAKALHAPAEAFDQTVSYIAVCSGGFLFIVAYNLVGSIFRGLGDSKIPLLTVAIACVFNIAGDLILVAVFDKGATGAAIATVAAQAFSVIISLFIMSKRKLPFTLRLKDIRPNGVYIKEVLRLGVPIALQDLLVSFSFLFITAIVNSLGLIVSAGVGVAERLCGFLMLVPSAFGQSMSAFVAQNVGAKKPERADKALFYGIIASFAAGLTIGYMAFFHGDVLASIFSKDTHVILAAAEYLKAYAIDCVLTAFLFCFTGYFNGHGCTMFVMLQGIVGAFCVRLPVAWIMSKRVPVSLFAIALATPISTVSTITMCLIYYAMLKKRLKTR